ncbi:MULTISPECIES: 4-(cytidine 5'-diphospho)-2-C-methyl-D-erythritol kinase [unclassified Iodidimonas]|jgi:4-diphosphocytidyl-2-C-methyl-D-erythritol kinase|uniref:4-(cytidine 5'-diphospho)-2-C-methyl-D-erythritol kinase n=1 Tax=unclassified Iodidimonas TaxID=2626145 RepID=UPI0024832391|nr:MULTISPECIES: 4-(cytidine 5'-diphospho)-2-C-methyl-D-erythritol kinase [unclassified Iodidimonas]
MIDKISDVTAFAPAKINLFLHITGRRDDGYHLLDSLFVFPALYDRLEISPLGREAGENHIRLRIDGPMAEALAGEADQNNLVIRAIRRLQGHLGITGSYDVRLIKNIPVAAGVGGGSADAAAALLACLKLWQHTIAADELQALAQALGADVPPCLQNRPVWVAGIGEQISPAGAAPPWGVILANPRCPVPTPDVFLAYKQAAGAFSPALPAEIKWQDLDWLARESRNDLYAAACGIAPAIGDLIAALAALPGARLARMSGSGATCFALFDDVAQALSAREILQAKAPQWWSWAGGLCDDQGDHA